MITLSQFTENPHNQLCRPEDRCAPASEADFHPKTIYRENTICYADQKTAASQVAKRVYNQVPHIAKVRSAMPTRRPQ